MPDMDPRYLELERAYVKAETAQRAIVSTITEALRDLAGATTYDDWELERFDEICDAVEALAFGTPRSVVPHKEARAAWFAAHGYEE